MQLNIQAQIYIYILKYYILRTPANSRRIDKHLNCSFLSPADIKSVFLLFYNSLYNIKINIVFRMGIKN